MKAKNILILSIIFISLLSSKSSLYAQLSNIRVHDPVLIKEKDTYHLFCTGPGISHFISNDMITWHQTDSVFVNKPTWTKKVVADFKNHIWAPDIVYKNGKFYLYYSVSAFGKNTSAIGVTTNLSLDPKNPKYKWYDEGIVIQSHPNRDLWNAIDPNIAFDDNDNPWLSFGSFWEGLKLVKLNKNLTAINEPQEWYTIARRHRVDSLTDADPGNAAIEAPFIFKKEGYYYLFVSWDYCCQGKNSTYKVVVGRAKNIDGPYFDKENKSMFQGGGSLVLKGNERWNGAGHCSVYTIEGKDFMIFHAYDANDEGKPKLRIETIEWDQNLWPIEIKNF
jgi:arabinan endo-1,5-alpha-L-arabinosidase